VYSHTFLPGQPVVEQVGHHQKSRRCFQSGRILQLQRQELKQRVDLHKLQAGLVKNFLARRDGKTFIEHCRHYDCRDSDAELPIIRRSGRAGQNQRPRYPGPRDQLPPASPTVLARPRFISPKQAQYIPI